jgi:cytochrome c peroxidase
MRKRVGIFAVFILLLSACFLQNCKHDPALTHNYNPNDPDSLYVGTPYGMPAIAYLKYPYRPINSPAGNPMTYQGIQLGRMLFYDSTLSLTGQVSCGHCHKQEYAFGDDTKLSQNVLGATVRNTPTLANMGMNSAFFWDGRQPTLEAAVDDAFNHEMRPDFTTVIRYLNGIPKYTYLFKKAFGRPGDITEDKIEKAIAQFLRTLTSTNSRIDQYYRGEIQLTTQEEAGLNAFFDADLGDCFHCHFDAIYLTFASQIPGVIYANNAIDTVAYLSQFADKGRGAIDGDSLHFGQFKIPTLRNVAVSAPYMHDGRYATLNQVIGHYSDSLRHSPNVSPGMQHIVARDGIAAGGLHLDAVGKANLLAFLNALTDTSFLHNPAFSNPFH